MTPQSSFVKDECCRLIRKGVCIPALARDEEIQGVHHRGHPRVVVVRRLSVVVRFQVGDGDRRRDRGRQRRAKDADSRA
jgi:hypothetical protein